MNKTENLNLPQWEATDMVQRADFNDAFSNLDTGYAAAMETAENALAAVSGVADAGALESLQAALESKAEQADLAALTETVAGKAAQADLTTLGNCRIEAGSYVGTGTYGTNGATTLTFSQPPVAVILQMYTLVRGASAVSNGSLTVYITWSGNSVSWYNTGSANSQANISGATYRYVAFFDQSAQ
jgi:hypothetical protein